MSEKFPSLSTQLDGDTYFSHLSNPPYVSPLTLTKYPNTTMFVSHVNDQAMHNHILCVIYSLYWMQQKQYAPPGDCNRHYHLATALVDMWSSTQAWSRGQKILQTYAYLSTISYAYLSNVKLMNIDELCTTLKHAFSYAYICVKA